VVVPAVTTALAASILRGAGDESQRIAGMWYVAFGLAIFVYIVVAGLVVFGAIRKPRATQGVEPPGTDAPDTHGESRALWIGGVIGPTLILVVLAVLTVTTTTALRKPEKDAVEVDVAGVQWWWDVSYPSTNVRTANEIHLPVDRAADIVLTTRDVIHSFWVPDLAGKLDEIPGQTNHLRFTPKSIGVFEGHCAEFCGLQHAHMGFLVIVQSQADFDRWLAREERPISVPPDDDAALRGAALFQNLSCAGCHTVRGTQAVGTIGPDLSDFGQRRTLGAVLADNTTENLGNWIVDAPRMKPGVKMPPVQLTNRQRDDVVAYLESLK
jgi:cytochrome c oxidase subunit 2